MLIMDSKTELGMTFDLDNFQVQAVGALLMGKNVILLAPTGSGKYSVFYLGVHVMRKKYSMPNGVGICLQPLNTILSEKTNSDLLIKTACLTMSGDALSAKEATLSYPMDVILSEDVGCLLC